MRKSLLLVFLSIPFWLWGQNQPPVAVPDTMEILSQDTVSMNILLNDYDPEGDDFEIRNLYNPRHGESWRQDSIAFYVSDYYYGQDSMKYRIHEMSGSNTSEWAYIHINVLENPDVPYAVNDTFLIRRLEPTVLDILANDGDPNGHELIINEISFVSNFFNINFAPDSSNVILTSYYNTPDEYQFHYKNREKGTDYAYYSNTARVQIIIEDNPEIPVAVNDTFQMTGGYTEVLDVLSNDHDPLGDTIEIYDYSSPGPGSVLLVDNKFQVTINTSFTGNVDFNYRWRYKNKPWLYTKEAEVFINVEKNPDCPIGEPDYGSGVAYTEIYTEVISNDSDPNGDEIEIKDVKCETLSSISFNGDTVIYLPHPCQAGPDHAYYRIQKVNNHDYFSEWIRINYDIEHNHAYPRAYPDSGRTNGGIELLIDFGSNDYIPDSIEFNNIIFVGNKLGEVGDRTDSTIIYHPYSRSEGRDTIEYRLIRFFQNPPLIALGEIYIDIENNHAYDSLNINNINAGFNASGYQFARIDELISLERSDQGTPHFEASKGGGKHTIHHNTLWMGGFDQSGQIHLAAQMYRWYGFDYQPGPVYFGDYDSVFFKKWNRIWKINLWEVNYHINNWWKDGYEPIEPIATWPGNGNGEGIAEQLAPFYDQNGDGIYDPHDGDYPLIRGEQCLYFITNDAKFHGETQGAPLLLEIHGMAYAYDAPNDSLLDNTIFIHYDLINRSENTYYDTYFGSFTQFTLGYAWDNYVASHVLGNSYYVYNDGYDGLLNWPDTGTYKDKPPAQSVTILAGPYMDADGEDNPSGECDHSLTGLNFGNGIADDERYGLGRFTFFSGSAGPVGYPNGFDYYRYMNGLWKDDSAVIFGGHGHYNSSGAVGPECRYMFPGDSDPDNWGTDCELPNEGFNQNGKYWTEEQAGNNPDDRKGMGSCGPFTFYPGDVQEVDVAFVVANSYYSADSSKKLLEARLMELRQRVLDGEIVIPNSELDINEGLAEKVSFEIYPNPAASVIHLQIPEELQNCEYFITNSMGTRVISGKLQNEINVAGLKPGFYIISIKTSNGILSNKFIKY